MEPGGLCVCDSPLVRSTQALVTEVAVHIEANLGVGMQAWARQTAHSRAGGARCACGRAACACRARSATLMSAPACLRCRTSSRRAAGIPLLRLSMSLCLSWSTFFVWWVHVSEGASTAYSKANSLTKF